MDADTLENLETNDWQYRQPLPANTVGASEVLSVVAATEH